MKPNTPIWEMGDFTKIAELMRIAGQQVVDSLDVKPGIRVLDLGCGDGNTALPFAQAGADVSGIDITDYLLEAGKRRAEEAGLKNVTFEKGDACDLNGVTDDTFDLTLSMFGAMFAPRPVDVAKTMVRVTKPGGRIINCSWIPGDPTMVSRMIETCMQYGPPPPEGAVNPLLWGCSDHIYERFAAAGVSKDQITLTEHDFPIISSTLTPDDLMDRMSKYTAPVMIAYGFATQTGKVQELDTKLRALANSLNRATDGSTNIPANYLRATVQL